MKTRFILIVAVSALLLTACQNGVNPPPSPSDGRKNGGAVVEENNHAEPKSESTPIKGELVIDDHINNEVVKVIQNYMQATHTKDEDLIRSTVLDGIGLDERAFSLWNNSESFELKQLTYGQGDEKIEVVSVTFTNDEILSFALTKTDSGWKIYDVD